MHRVTTKFGEVSVGEQKKNGRTHYRIRETVDGTRKVFTGTTIIEACRKYEVFHASQILGPSTQSPLATPTTKAAPLFKEYAESWLASKTSQLKPTSAARLAGIVRNHLIPGVGRFRLDGVLPSKILAVYAKATNDGLAGSSLVKMHDVLKQIFSQAEGDRLIHDNPMSWVKRPKYEEPEMEFYSKTQLEHLMSIAAQYYPRFWPFVVIAAQTGMRQGEIQGMQWKHIDFDHNLILIRQAISEVGGRQKVGALKTGQKGRRDIPMMSLTRQALEFQRKVLLSGNLSVEPDAYVFPCTKRRTTGPAIGKSTILDRWKALVTKAELPYIKFHGLRHSHGTFLADEGMPVKNIMARLGHRTMAMANRYTHAIAETEVCMINEFDKKWACGMEPIGSTLGKA